MGSQSVAAPAESSPKASFKGKTKVRYGDRVNLRGEFPGAARGSEVAILHRKSGAGEFKRVDSTRTKAQGRWAEKVKPKKTGDWRAELTEDSPEAVSDSRASDSQTGAKRIRVRSVTKVKPAKRNVTVGQKVKLAGVVKPGGQREVKVDLGKKTIRTRTNKRGRFAVTTKATSTGTYAVRAASKRNKFAGGSKDSGPKVTAYRYAQASWYGPGFYGNRTACGQTLTPSTRGVANKSLPCGTKLKLRYHGRTVNVRVIDRGPYHGNREFDLTRQTKEDLGFGSTGAVLSSR